MPRALMAIAAAALLTVSMPSPSQAQPGSVADERRDLQYDVQDLQGSVESIDDLLDRAAQGDLIHAFATPYGVFYFPMTQLDLARGIEYALMTADSDKKGEESEQGEEGNLRLRGPSDVPDLVQAYAKESRGAVAELRKRREELLQRIARDRSRLAALDGGTSPEGPPNAASSVKQSCVRLTDDGKILYGHAANGACSDDASGPAPAGAPAPRDPTMTDAGKAAIVGTSGEASVFTADGSQIRAADSARLNPGDRIVTGMGGSATVRLPDGSVVRVNELSDVRLDEYAEGSDSVRTRLWLKAGEVSADVNERGQLRSDFQVKTPTATIGVKGTQFTVRHAEVPAPLTTVSVSRGEVEVTPVDPTLAVARARPGSEVRVGEHGLAYSGDVSVTQRGGPVRQTEGHVPPPQAGASQTADVFFAAPMIKGAPVDGCATWATNCGKPAADQFCQTQGFVASLQSSWAFDPRTYVIGSSRYCTTGENGMKCGGLRNVVCTRDASRANQTAASLAGPATAQTTDPRAIGNMLMSAAWTWFDNGKNLGTTGFGSDGNCQTERIPYSCVWRVQQNGDLLIYANGNTWITRLVYDTNSDAFSGMRDATSQTQDGVRTVLRRATATNAPATPAAGLDANAIASLLASAKWNWAEGTGLRGSIQFDRDGNCAGTWFPGISCTWRVQPNGDVLVDANHEDYITHFRYQPAKGTFEGPRDSASHVQDGIYTVMSR